MNEIAFIKQNTSYGSAPFVPEIKLHLAHEITPVWYAHEGWLNAINVEPPYWAFAWAGGQGVARYILDHPQLFRGKRVLDFATGGGIVAIAAAQVGAAAVTAVDIDPMAAVAAGLNATENGAIITPLCCDIVGEDVVADCIVTGDICYAEAMTARVLPWLRRQAQRGIAVYVGDPGRAYFPADGYDVCAEYTIAVSVELEDRTTRSTRVVRLQG
jgi:predicted nicotinamide N-methyase